MAESVYEEETAPHPVREVTCRVADLSDATHDIRVVRLEVIEGGPFTFSAGQYASLAFEGQPPRDYSMANRPDEPLLEFHIRYLHKGAASAFVADRLKVGDRVTVRGPFGESWLRRAHGGPILAIAGGSGLAPIKSIVETALKRGMRQDIHLYFGARDERDVYLEDRFEALARNHPNLRFTPVLSEPAAPTGRRIGFVTDAVAEDFADLSGFKAYVAGPPAMVEAATEALGVRGVPSEDIHADAFYSDSEKWRMHGAP